jgi:hypothetical protein
VLTETFVGPDRQPIAATPGGADPATARVSYFTGGDATRPARDLGTFERIDLGEVFPGIRVHLRATGANVEKIFTVAPARTGRIRLRVGGATRLGTGVGGRRSPTPGNGPLAYTAPVAFRKTVQGRREPVASATNSTPAATRYRFALAGTTRRGRWSSIRCCSRPTWAATGEQSAGDRHPPVSGDDLCGGIRPPIRASPASQAGCRRSTADPRRRLFRTAIFVARFSANLTSLVRSTYLGGAGDAGRMR